MAALTALATAAAAPSAQAAPGDLVVGSYSAPDVQRLTPGGVLSPLASGAPLVTPFGFDTSPGVPLAGDRVWIADGDLPGILSAPLTGGTASILAQAAPNYAEPLDVEVGLDGLLYVAEFGGGPVPPAILQVNPLNGATSPIAVGGLITNPHALVVATDMTIFIADGSDGQVLRRAPSGAVTLLATIPGGAGEAQGIEQSPDGTKLWVADDGNEEIWEVTIGTGAIRSLGTIPGSPSLYNLALEPAGTLVFPDSNAGAVRRFNPATGAVSTVAAIPNAEGIAVEPQTCGTKPLRIATITGTDAGETITGSPRHDVIAALGGDDTVIGADGNDVICGGAGNDRLVGLNGNEYLYGDAGRDTLLGGNGKDKLRGGNGKDKLRGGGGVDHLDGGKGNDDLAGGKGRDREKS